MKIDATRLTGTFAAEIPGAIGVFEALGIDYACFCDRSLEDAAHAEGIAPDVVIASLRRLKTVQDGETWSDRPLSDLTRRLVQEHHHFVRHELGRMAMLLSDLCTGQDASAGMRALRAAFTRLTETLLPHLLLEERDVFPAIEGMEEAWQSGERASPPADLTAALRRIADEHGVICAQLRAIRDLGLSLDEDDLPPRWGTALENLAMLEAHLHQNMFLENWILFPRAAALAGQLREVPLTVR
jgi:regulator of cell morphogenesis and NO signaling